MAVAEELQVIIDAKTGKAVKDLKNFDGQMKKTEKSAGDVAKAMLKKGAAAAAAAISIRAIISVVKESITLYGRQIQAETRLSAAIEATGGSADELLPKYKDLASEIQNLTIIGDEASLEMIQLATSMGVTEDKMEETTKGAIGLSKAFGIGTEQAVRGVALAMQGNFEALQRYIPQLRTATTDAEKMEAVQKAMADGFDLATAEAQTGFGAIAQYENAVGDLKEELGRAVVEGAKPFIQVLTGFASRTAEAIGKTREFKEILESLGDDGVESITSLAEAEKALEGVKAKQTAAYGSSITESIRLFGVQKDLEAQIERLNNLETERNRVLKQYGEVSAEYIEWAANKVIADEANASALEQLESRQDARLSSDERQLKEARKQIDALLELEAEIKNLGQDYSDITSLIKDYAKERDELVKKIKEEGEVARQTTQIAAEGWEAKRQAILHEVELEEYLAQRKAELAELDIETTTNYVQQTLDGINTIYSAYQGFFSALNDLRDNAHQKELNAIDAEIQAAKDAGEDTAVLEQEKQDLITAHKKKAWETDKKGKLLQAFINTANAVTAALPNVFLAAAVGALGAAQVGLIAGTSNPYRSGGIINEPVVGTGQRTGQSYSFGEAGPEMVSPTSGGGSDNLHVVINLDGKVISDFITKGTRSKRILVDQRAVV